MKDDDYYKWKSYREKILFIFLILGLILGFGIVILSILIKSVIGAVSGMLVGFSLVGFGMLLSVLFYEIIKRKFPSKFTYEEWEKTAAEMGLHEPENHLWVEGDYRNHHLAIYQREWPDPEGGVDVWTNCDVKFENPKTILMGIKKREIPYGMYIRDKRAHRFEVGDPKFDRAFYLAGNREDEVKTILDPSIRNKLMNFKGWLGFGLIEFGYDYSSAMTTPPWKFWDPGSIGLWYIDPQSPLGSNVARWRAGRSLDTVKLDARRIRLVVDIMIDIIEKIEANATST